MLLLVAACAAPPAYDRLDRDTFNTRAQHADAPLYWEADRDADHAVDPDEVVTLLFYPTADAYVVNGAFTDAFAKLYETLVAEPEPASERERLVRQDLDAGRPTLLHADLRGLTSDERTFADHILAAARGIDTLFARQLGLDQLHPAPDAASRSLFRRNWGPRCVGPKTETAPACTAAAAPTKAPVAVYPADRQADPGFCTKLPANLLTPFTVVRGDTTVPYPDVWGPEMGAVAQELRAAADALAKVPGETAMVAYLDAAAASFGTNDWTPADEAWAKMNAENSKWYLRVGPDETYWEPCSQKAGFHLTFARINRASLDWQARLAPRQTAMEHTIAAAAGAPYVERSVSFHLPDFIDIVVNAGDDRSPLGATTGQSLPNWGPVADEGRGRTVAMSNLYTDADSIARRRALAASVLDAASLAALSDSPEPDLLSTILHEATHNLGPAADYRVDGKNDAEAFGGPLAAMLEELKAQTGALAYVEGLRADGVISAELARDVYVDGLVWGFGHISEGMVDVDGTPKPYPQLAAIQTGYLLDHGALSWDPAALAANGTDKGAFVVHFDVFPDASRTMLDTIAGIKARGDRAAAEALVARYVTGDVVPHAVLRERYQRQPRATFVYAVDL